MVLSADFVYTRGSNLATLVNLNQPLPNAAGNNALGALPYPNFGFIEWRAQNGKSGVQGRRPRAREALRRTATPSASSYTLGDSKDNSSEQLTTQGSNAFPQNARDFRAWYGPSDYDVRHRFTANFVWAAAARRQHRSRATGRCRASTRKRSGRPFTVNQSSNNVGTNMTGLPNVVGDTEGSGDGGSVVQHGGVSGRAVRARSATSCATGSRGPGFQNFDLTFQRQIRFGSAPRGDAALGHLQRVQHGQFRPAEPEHQRCRDVRHDLEPVERSAHHADRGALHVLKDASHGRPR